MVLRLAEALHAHKKLVRVFYPTLFEDPEQKRIFDKQCEFPGGIFSIEFAGGKEAALAFLRNVRLVRCAVSLGGVETLACHPKSTTHSGMTAEELVESGSPTVWCASPLESKIGGISWPISSRPSKPSNRRLSDLSSALF